MAMELCLEAAGGLVHALDLAWFDRRFPAPKLGSGAGTEPCPSAATAAVDGQVDLANGPGLDRAVRQSVDRLPINDAKVMWLVDVCGMSYHEAGAEMGLDRAGVAQTIDRARRRVRADLLRPLPPV